MLRHRTLVRPGYIRRKSQQQYDVNGEVTEQALFVGLLKPLRQTERFGELSLAAIYEDRNEQCRLFSLNSPCMVGGALNHYITRLDNCFFLVENKAYATFH
jgi:hypothetical protein